MTVIGAFLLCAAIAVWSLLVFSKGYISGMAEGSSARELELWRLGRMKDTPPKPLSDHDCYHPW